MNHSDFRGLVDAEYWKNQEIHGYDSQHTPHFWLGLVIKQIGEVAHAINTEQDPIPELTQVCAVIEAWADNTQSEAHRKEIDYSKWPDHLTVNVHCTNCHIIVDPPQYEGETIYCPQCERICQHLPISE